MENKSNIIGPLLGLFSAFIWSLAFVSVKIALKTFGPNEIAALRFLISGTLGAITLYLNRQFNWPLKDILQVSFAALIGMAIYNICLNSGQTSIKPSAASFIVSTQPIFTIIAARFMFREKIGLNAILGVSFCLFGVWLILGNPDYSAFFKGGALWLIGASFCSGMYFVLLMPLIRKYGAVNAAAAAVLATGFILSPWLPKALLQAQIEIKPTLAVVFLACFPGFIAHITWMSAIQKLGSTNAANFTFLIAPMATISSILIVGDTINANFIVGSLLVVFGVFLTINQKVKSKFLRLTKVAI